MTIGGIEIHFWERTSLNSIPSYLLSNGDTKRLRLDFEQCYRAEGIEKPESVRSDDFYLWMTNDRVLHDFLELRLRASIETELRQFLTNKPAAFQRQPVLYSVQAWFARMKRDERLQEFAIPLRDSSKLVTTLYSFMPSDWCFWPMSERMREFMLPALYEFYCYQLDECYRIFTRHYDFDEIIMVEGKPSVRLAPRDDLVSPAWSESRYWPKTRKPNDTLIEV